MKNGLLRRLAPIVAVGAVSLLALIGCNDPSNNPSRYNPPQLLAGPIYLQNSASPTLIPNNTSATWTVKVFNSGPSAATISQATYRERIIIGWATGSYDYSGNLPITANQIPGFTTKTIFSMSRVLTNSGSTDLVYENTVTVNSDGGDDQVITNYTVQH